jgi:hypothetical protein
VTRAFVLLLLLAQPARTPPTPQDWDAAERAIVRLKPAAFKDLPANVRADLDRRQCTIPQPGGLVDVGGPHNVISGQFTSQKSTDIAVLCSTGGVSSILVYRGGATKDVAMLAAMADKGFLQTGPENRIEFSRALRAASPARMRIYHEAFGTGQMPRLDHDGIEDAFVGKASTVRYWTGGKWQELQGAD